MIQSYPTRRPSSRRSRRSRWFWTSFLSLILGGCLVLSAEILLLHPAENLFLLICIVVISFFHTRLSALDHLFSIGVGSAVLGILAPGDDPFALLALWGSGVFIGTLLQKRRLHLSTEQSSYAMMAGSIMLYAWGLFEQWSFDPVGIAALAILSYFLTRVVISVIRSLTLVEVSFSATFRSARWSRVVVLYFFNVVICLLCRMISDSFNAALSFTDSRFGTMVSFTVTAALFFGLSMLRQNRQLTKRLDGLLHTALSLPWDIPEPVQEQARRFAQLALPGDRILIRNSPALTPDEISAVSIGADGRNYYLVAQRNASQSSFNEQERHLLDAVAHIAAETVRISEVTADLQRAANTDELTGLPNYRAFQDALVQMNRKRSPGSALAVLYIDVDNFKSINDDYGHEVGNVVLQTIAGRLSAAIRAGDMVARVGGDEFVMILSNVGQREDAALIAERILNQASTPIPVGKSFITVQMTRGMSYSDQPLIDPSSLVESADLEMYSARGRALVGLNSDTPSRGIRLHDQPDTETMVNTIQEAITQGRLAVVYQPIVDRVEKKIIAFEALVRYTDSQLGAIPVKLLIHEAQRLDLLSEVTRQVLEQAYADMIRFQEITPELTTVHVNIEVDQVVEPDFQGLLQRLRQQTPSVKVLLELSETSLSRAPEETVDILHGMHEEGLIQLALDDFGQAYSTLLSVVEYPFDVLKVDKALTRNLDQSKPRLVMRSLALLSRKLDVQMVVEGVETIEQYKNLSQLGARYLQGYLFSRPISAEAALLRLSSTGLRAELRADTGSIETAPASESGSAATATS